MINKEKIKKGQFFTKDKIWLKPQIIDFIKSTKCNIAYDPFAGAGDLLKISENYGIKEVKGLDIDEKLGWDLNDGLINIPHLNDAIIITNPPYLTKYSASRKKIMEDVKKYFDSSDYEDVYMIALENMLEAQKNVVAIIPETFLNSTFKSKSKLNSVTVLEDNPFEDTDVPVCVVCFDGVEKSLDKIKVYKNEKYIFTLNDMENLRLKTKNNVKITFNDPNGWLGLRAVDTTNPSNMIKFDYKENFDYDWNKGIKVSSRLLSTISIEIPNEIKKDFIEQCNTLLFNLRNESSDLILSPFKGNMKNGVRRRRLDYYTARCIMEEAYRLTIGGKLNEQLRLF